MECFKYKNTHLPANMQYCPDEGWQPFHSFTPNAEPPRPRKYEDPAVRNRNPATSLSRQGQGKASIK
jgi:hypothetical protein